MEFKGKIHIRMDLKFLFYDDVIKKFNKNDFGSPQNDN